MSGIAPSPFTEPVPVAGGTASTSPSPFVSDIEHDAEKVFSEVEGDAEAALADVKAKGKKVLDEVETDIEEIA